MPSRSGSFSPESASTSDRDGEANREKSKKPDNTAFKQQRLPAWQPILTAHSVLPGFFVLSLIFIPIGVVLLTESNSVKEYSTEYTVCESLTSAETCSDVRSNATRMDEDCTCNQTLDIKEAMTGDVYVYYGLTNFFQNHRRYVKSRDDVQLNGQTQSNVSTDCAPFNHNNGTPIAPCGAIANSMFNDTFKLFGLDGGAVVQFSIARTGIAWPTDKGTKFKNPKHADGTPLSAAFAGTTKPFYWPKPVYELDNVSDNNGYENEALIVWMRTAAFPTFRKPYGRITNGLAAGVYNITVDYNYPVVEFDGTKRFIVSTTSWVGGKNNFLGIAYIVVGSICFVTGIALCIVHHVTKKPSTNLR